MEKNLNLLRNATVRNARICSDTENFGLVAKFTDEFDTKFWVGNNVTMFGASGGFLFMNATSMTPNMYHSLGFSPVDASEFTQVVIRYKYNRRRLDSVADKGVVQFQTIADATWSSDKQLEFDVNPDGKWHKYTLNMGPVSEWVGLISNLRFYFTINGAPGDEIFVTDIRIQSPVFTFCPDGCIDDSSVTILGQLFNTEGLGTTPNGWSLSNTDADRRIYIDLDPEHRNSNSQVAHLICDTSVFPGPKMTRGVTSHQKGFFSCRFRTTGDGTGGQHSGRINVLVNTTQDHPLVELSLEADGYLKYRQGSTFENFSKEYAYSQNVWYDLLIVYDISINAFDVYINGELLGRGLPVVFSGLIRGISVEHGGGNPYSFYVDDILLVELPLNHRECPGLGRQAEAVGRGVSFTYLNIIENVNDSIIVNIDSYGDVVVKLFPEKNVDGERLRYILERAISQLDIGGYPYSEVDFKDGQFTIRSGTYDFDSNVEIKKHGTSTLSDDLGFTIEGNPVYITRLGRPHAKGFNFINTYRATTYDLSNLITDQRGTDPVVQNPRNTTPHIGTSRAGYVGAGVKIDGRANTLVDYYNRANSEGRITKVRVQGVLPTAEGTVAFGTEGTARGKYFDTGEVDLGEFFQSDLVDEDRLDIPKSLLNGAILRINEPGYAGNGEYAIEIVNPISTNSTFASYRKGVIVLKDTVLLPSQTNLSWEILRISKIKHLRPDIDGNLTLINEASIGLENSGVLYTKQHGAYEIDVDWLVRRGDLIGIYNATELFSGNNVLQIPDAMYIEYSSDLVGDNVTVSPPEGEGIEGIGLFGEGITVEDLAVYDIDLGSPISLEAVEVVGSEEIRQLEYNLFAAAGNGVSLAFDGLGLEHRHDAVRTNGQNEIHYHPNIGYNISALTDNILFAKNGVVGAHETNDSRATYFYVDGDAEWIELEFPDPPYLGAGTSEYQDDPIRLEFSWLYKKNIHRMRIFYKEFPNLAGYQIEYQDDPQVTYDGSVKGYRLIGGFEVEDTKYETVTLDDRGYDREIVVTASAASPEDSHVHLKHFEKKYDVYYKGGSMTKDEKRNFDAALYHPYLVIDKTWEEIETKGINLYSFYHYSTKISEIQMFSQTTSESDLQDIVELFYSKDGEYFQSVTPVQIDDTTIRFVIGNPARYLRLIFSPFSLFNLDRLVAIADADLIQIRDTSTGQAVKTIDVDLVKGQESPPKSITLTNKTGSRADLEISVETHEFETNTLLKTDLNTKESIQEPEYGPPGIIVQDALYDFPVTQNVAVNSECYGLKNLSIGKKYYVIDNVLTESDFFVTGIDHTKWEYITNDFPQTINPTTNINLRFPGFQMIGEPPQDVYPNPGTEMEAYLISRWITDESFIATVNCVYDAGGSHADVFGSAIGVVDQTGRLLTIRRNRALYTDGSGLRSWADYIIEDNGSQLDSSRIFCQGTCSTIFGNSNDALVPYELRVQRVKNPEAGLDILKFYFKDALNFEGVYQWGEEYDPLDPEKELGYVLDLSSLTPTLVGPLRIVIFNLWHRSSLNPSGSSSSSDGTFVRITNFKFAGKSNYVSPSPPGFIGSGIIGPTGKINVDNITDNVLARPIKSVAVDLGSTYAVDFSLLDIFNGEPGIVSANMWDIRNILFSSTNTDNLQEVKWGDFDTTEVRWVLLQEITTNNPLDATLLHSLRVYPDITLLPVGKIINTEWDSLGNVLTDGDFDNRVSQVDYPVIAVRLANQFSTRNFQLLSKENEEYRELMTRPNDFSGWYNVDENSPNFYYTMGFTITDDPRRVSWRGWDEYPFFTNFEAEKGIQAFKWVAFRNSLLNNNNPPANRQYAAQLKVTTLGIDYTDAGQVNDRVDFTEYSEWFDNSLQEFVDVSLIDWDELGFDGLLYGAGGVSDPGHGIGNEPTGASNLFDGDEDTELLLRADNSQIPNYFYRIFGTVSGSFDTDDLIGNPVEEEGDVEEGEVEAILLPETKTIHTVEIRVRDNTSAVPRDFELQVFSGGTNPDPEEDSLWITLESFSDAHESFGVFIQDSEVGGLQGFETDGKFFSYTFDAPITVTGIRVKITDFEDVGGNYQICNLQSFRTLEEVPQDISNRLVIDNDPDIRHRGRRSLKLTYLAGGSGTKNATMPKSFEIDPDVKWSIQDFLSFHLKVENLFELDLDDSYIRLGESSSEYYEWGFDQLEGLSEGSMSNYKLRFKDARDKGGSPEDYERSAHLVDLAPGTNFMEGPINYFEIGLTAFNPGASSDINVWFDDFIIDRENFSLPGLHNDTLYLANSELVYFPLAGFDMRKGFFEAIITPDWNREGRIETYNLQRPGDQVYTIFSATNGASEYMALYYTTREQEGLKFVINTPEGKVDLVVGEIVDLLRYESHLKISILWDNEGKRIDARSGATVRLFLDDNLIGDMVLKWDITETKDTYFLIGSKAYVQAVTSPSRQFVEFGFNEELRPVVNSLHGGIENLLVMSDPIKVDFDKIQNLRDKILISLDNITYYAGNSSDLPLRVQNVPADGEIEIFIKTNFPSDTSNMPRSGFVKARWLKTV